MTSSKPENELVRLLGVEEEIVAGYLIPDVRLAGKHLVIVDAYLPDHHAVIEYDGRYWHQKRKRADIRKTKMLLRADYSVIRLREDGLFMLDVEHPKFHQVTVSPRNIESVIPDVIRFIRRTG